MNTNKQDQLPSKKRPELTPEYIAEQRALREARKKAKREEKERLGIRDENEPEYFDTSFIKRPMLKFSDRSGYENGNDFTLMTYNALAQCLVRRKLFPENGKLTLKWKNRCKVLIGELEHYRPNVLCMQEVDEDKVEKFWIPELKKRVGMEALYRSFDGKKHGQIIAFREDMFEIVSEKCIKYDDEETPGAKKQVETRNTGMIIALKFKNSKAKTPGVIIGTTHMFWHPMGSYERTRQLAVLTKKAVEFGADYEGWPVFLAGDYNSECFDTPYLCASKKPVSLDEDALEILRLSAQHRFAKFAAEDEDEEQEGEATSSTNEPPAASAETVQKKIDSLIQCFDDVPYDAISLYKDYKQVHPANVHPKGPGEPIFSNWAHAWRGLLDYIFVMQKHGQATPVRCTELLRMPEPHEMGREPSGQPREGQYPSDHLCMMARVSVP